MIKKILTQNSKKSLKVIRDLENCVFGKEARALIFEQENATEETVFQRDQIEYLEDEKLKLEEKINSFLKSQIS